MLIYFCFIIFVVLYIVCITKCPLESFIWTNFDNNPELAYKGSTLSVGQRTDTIVVSCDLSFLHAKMTF